jgi:hypothetical protein
MAYHDLPLVLQYDEMGWRKHLEGPKAPEIMLSLIVMILMKSNNVDIDS